MIFIFGDSHTRSFQNINNIMPFFFGQGQKFSLNNANYKRIKNNINIFFKKYDKFINDSDMYFLYFGEPDCRYLVDNNYYPFNKPMKSWKEYKTLENNKKYLEVYINNYEKIVNCIKEYTNNYYIITPTTGFFPTFFYLDEFNRLLCNRFSNNVVNIYKNIFDDNKNIKQKLLNKDMQYDPIHLNENNIDILLETLIEQKIIKDRREFESCIHKKNNFKKNSKFNTYDV